MQKNDPLDSYALQLAGKLLRYEELQLPQDIISQLLEEKSLQTTPSIKRHVFTSQCMRCGNQQGKLFATIPCKKCHENHLYCRNCIQMGRIMECEPLYYWTGSKPNWKTYEEPCTWTGTLTSAQEKAAEKIKMSILNQEDELLTWAVCGAGKTEMLFPGITAALETGKRICLATPRTDVVRELTPRLERAFEKVPIQALYGGSSEKIATAQFIIATTHQLLRFQSVFDVLIIDEIDAFPFHGDPSLPFATKRSRKQQGTTIYLTATPRKNHQQAIRQKKLNHVFVPIRYHGHPLPVPTSQLMTPLDKTLVKNQLPDQLTNWFSQRKQIKRQILIFVPTIERTEKIGELLIQTLQEKSIIKNQSELTFVHSQDKERAEKVDAFRKKELTVIVTTTILERGVTFPSVDVLVLDAGHDVFDEAALVQIAGRAGRSAADPTGEVIFFHDGKTEAMVAAVRMIKQMNQRGRSVR